MRRTAAIVLALAPAVWGQNPWTSAGRLIVGRTQHTATLLHDGRVLLVGGDCAAPPQSMCGGTAEIYDPATKRFAGTGSMVVGRFDHAATLLPDGRVLIVGGVSGARNPRTVEVYDPRTGVFSRNGELKNDHPYCFTVLMEDGRVMVGGMTPTEIYDPRDGTSVTVQSGVADGAKPVALANGRLLFAGGNSSLFVVYDVRTQKFEPVATPSAPVFGFGLYDAVTALSDGGILVTGGTPIGTWNSATNGSALYRPTETGFAFVRMTRGMAEDRNAHTATLLPDGTVLLVGGNAGGDMTEINELFDPATLRFSTVAGSTLRASHTATLLPDGSVFVAGGSVQTDYLGLRRQPLNGAELFVPEKKVPSAQIFTVSGAQGAVLHAGSSRVVNGQDPAEAGEVLEVYAGGLAENGLIPPQMAVGGLAAEVLYFGAAPGYPGLFQINVRVPDGVAPGSAVTVRMNYMDRPSNQVTIGVR